jgi:hypothetical protein
LSAASQETAGRRLFPDQLILSESFVEDELALPSVLHIRKPSTGKQRQAGVTTIDGEIKKRITRDFEASISGGLSVLDQDDAPLLAGFDNLELGVKYQFLRDPVREAVGSAALTWEVGGTGRAASGAESFDTLRPAFLFAKGLGDLPDRMALLKPLALGGLVGADIPLRSISTVESRSISAAKSSSIWCSIAVSTPTSLVAPSTSRTPTISRWVRINTAAATCDLHLDAESQLTQR